MVTIIIGFLSIAAGLGIHVGELYTKPGSDTSGELLLSHSFKVSPFALALPLYCVEKLPYGLAPSRVNHSLLADHMRRQTLHSFAIYTHICAEPEWYLILHCPSLGCPERCSIPHLFHPWDKGIYPLPGRGLSDEVPESSVTTYGWLEHYVGSRTTLATTHFNFTLANDTKTEDWTYACIRNGSLVSILSLYLASLIIEPSASVASVTRLSYSFHNDYKDIYDLTYKMAQNALWWYVGDAKIEQFREAYDWTVSPK